MTIGHHRITIEVITFFSISKHKANTTELHPKVRQTCFQYVVEMIQILLLYLSYKITQQFDKSKHYTFTPFNILSVKYLGAQTTIVFSVKN